MSFRFKPKSDDDRILMNMFEQTIPDTVPELSKRYNCSKATIWGVFNKYRFVYKIEETTYYFYRVKRVAQLVYQDLKSYPHDIVAERSKRLGMCPSDIIAGLKYLKRNYPEMPIPKESITFIKNQFLAIKDDWIRYPFSTLHERSQRLGYKNFIIHRYLSFLNVNLKISHTKEMDIRNVMFHLETPPTHKQILNEFEIYPRELKVIFLKHKDRFNVQEKNYTAFRMRRIQEFINYWIREAPWVNLEELRIKVHLTQGIFDKLVEKAKEQLNVRT